MPKKFQINEYSYHNALLFPSIRKTNHEVYNLRIYGRTDGAKVTGLLQPPIQKVFRFEAWGHLVVEKWVLTL